MIGLSNEEIFRLYRESDEASFTIFLEKYIEWLVALDIKGDKNVHQVCHKWHFIIQ